MGRNSSCVPQKKTIKRVDIVTASGCKIKISCMHPQTARAKCLKTCVHDISPKHPQGLKYYAPTRADEPRATSGPQRPKKACQVESGTRWLVLSENDSIYLEMGTHVSVRFLADYEGVLVD